MPPAATATASQPPPRARVVAPSARLPAPARSGGSPRGLRPRGATRSRPPPISGTGGEAAGTQGGLHEQREPGRTDRQGSRAAHRGPHRHHTIIVATDRPKLDKEGKTYKDPQTGFTAKEVQFHKVTTFNGLAKAIANNRNKGDLVAVEGRLHYTKWQDNGVDRYGCEIVADRVEFY